MVVGLCEIIRLGCVLDFNLEAVDILFKSRNIYLFIEEEGSFLLYFEEKCLLQKTPHLQNQAGVAMWFQRAKLQKKGWCPATQKISEANFTDFSGSNSFRPRRRGRAMECLQIVLGLCSDIRGIGIWWLSRASCSLLIVKMLSRCQEILLWIYIVLNILSNTPTPIWCQQSHIGKETLKNRDREEKRKQPHIWENKYFRSFNWRYLPLTPLLLGHTPCLFAWSSTHFQQCLTMFDHGNHVWPCLTMVTMFAHDIL